MLSVDKPGSPEEILEHFGKKGMKWGVRNKPQRGIGPTRSSREFAAKFPTGKSRANEIRRARNAQAVRAAKYHATPKHSAQRDAARRAVLNHPDRATAMRMTRGEKVVFALLGASAVASAPATGITGPAFAVGLAGGSAASVGVRRNLEKRARGG